MGCANSTSNIQKSTPLDDSTDLLSILFVNRSLIVGEEKLDHQQHYGNQKFHLDQCHQKQEQTFKEDAELLKEINFEPLIEYFAKTYELNFSTIAKDLKTYDIKGLEIVMNALYSELINQKLMAVNQMKINIKQCKIQIAQSMLSFLVDTIKFVIQNHSIEHGKAVFARLQKFSKNLSSFLKTKYPQGLNVDAGKLSQEFKEFDCTQEFDHDIIANARVIFKTKKKKFKQIEKLKKKKEVKNIQQNFIGNFLNSLSLKANPQAQELANNHEQQSQISHKPRSNYSEGTQFGKMRKGSSENQQNYNQNEYEYKNYEGEQTDSDISSDQEEKEYQGSNHDVCQFEITNNIKILLNRIMDQIDRNYQKFSQLIKSIDTNFKVSRKISENTARCTKLDTGVVEITSIEIARVLVKWLENLEEIIEKPQQIFNPKYQIKVSKYDKFNEYSTVRQINIKQDRARQRKEELKYAKCPEKQFEKLMEQGEIVKKLKKGYQRYKQRKSLQKSQKYEQYFKQFSTFILANLQNSSLDQREISTSEMQIVKYTFQISNLISWIVEQKLIAIIKILTSISEQFRCEKGVPNLVKFKVNDLMRCHLSGDQKTIKEAYDKILEKQTKGQIDIIKIKNRFHTDNHDAMVLFKMKGSFLICECQLALSEEYYKNDERIKNIQVLNHFLYELERSPFGIFGQLSVFLKTESHTVSSFYSKLKLKPNNNRVQNMKTCYKIKQQSKKGKTKNKNQDKGESDKRKKLQLKPFVCSFCFKYFQEYENYEKDIFSCQRCAINVCSHCQENKLMQKNKKIIDPSDKHKKQTEKNFKDLHLCIKKRVRKSEIQINKDNDQKNEQNSQNDQDEQSNEWEQSDNELDDIKMEKIFEPLPEQALRINPDKQYYQGKAKRRDQIYNDGQNNTEEQDKGNKQKELQNEQRRQNRIKAEKLMQYFQKTESMAIQNSWKIHFVIFSKIGNHQHLLVYRYNSLDGVIENVYSPIEKYLKHEYIELLENDKIFLFKNIYRTRVSKKQYLDDFIQNEKNEELQRIEEEDDGQNSQQSKSQNIQNQSQAIQKLSTSVLPIKSIQKQTTNTNNSSSGSFFDFFSVAINSFTNKPTESERNQIFQDKGEEQNKFAKAYKKNAEENPGERIQKFQEILRQCKLPFEYQQQIKITTLIKPSIHEFYFFQYRNPKEISNQNQSIYFLIDAQFSKGNGQKNCIAKQLSKLPKIKSLKKQIDLSNLGANSQELITMHQIIEKTVSQLQLKQMAGILGLTTNIIPNHVNKQRPFEWIKNVKLLDLSKNTLNDISILSSICPNLQRLNISQNIVQKLQFKDEFKFLHEIKAQDNLIQTVKTFSFFKKLEILHLSQNNIDQFIPDYFCSKIKEIDLSHNYVEKTDTFHKMKSLEILNMFDNSVEKVDFEQFPKTLKSLNLEYNKLKKIKNIDKLEHLESINVERNWLKRFEVSGYLRNLSCVNISVNPLKKLSLQNAYYLSQLYLDSTNLTDQKIVSMVIQENGLQNLEILSIKSNSLTKIPNLSHLIKEKHLQKLKKVWMDNNPILYGIEKKYAIGMPETTSLESEPDSQQNQQKQKEMVDVKIEEEVIQNGQLRFQEDLEHIQYMVKGGIEFILPVEQGLLNNNQSHYFEHLSKLNNKFKDKKICYQFFESQKQNESDSERTKFYRQKPQTKKTHWSQSSNQNSKKQKQIDLAETGNHIYMRHVQEKSQIMYYYCKDEENIGFEKLWHPDIKGIDFERFFMFNWSRLTYINLAICGIDDQKWNQFVQNATNQMPHLSVIDIAKNNIQSVSMSQLQSIKSLKCIYFHQYHYYQQNPLSDRSLFEIAKFNTAFNPQRWAISDDNKLDQYQKYEESQQYQVPGEQRDEDY